MSKDSTTELLKLMRSYDISISYVVHENKDMWLAILISDEGPYEQHGKTQLNAVKNVIDYFKKCQTDYVLFKQKQLQDDHVLFEQKQLEDSYANHIYKNLSINDQSLIKIEALDYYDTIFGDTIKVSSDSDEFKETICEIIYEKGYAVKEDAIEWDDKNGID